MRNPMPTLAAPDDAMSASEAERLQALRKTGLLDSAPEPVYDEITELAANICDVPVCLISLVDKARQWFKSAHGLGCRETNREDSICTYTIRQEAPLVVDDLVADERFASSALVREGIRIRAYAGVTIHGPEGDRLGALCVIDFVPRKFTKAQVRALRSLACQVETQIALRQEMAAKNELMRELEASRRRFEVFMDHCPVSAYIKDGEGRLRWYNRRFAEMYRISMDAWLEKTEHDLWPRKMADAIRRTESGILAGGKEVNLEVDSPGPAGTTLHWRSCKFPFSDAAGEWYVGGVAVEVTEERQRQAELQAAGDKLRSANAELLRVSEMDQLTQVGNRRSFDLSLQRCFRAARHEERPLSLILLDIDRFKQLNDRHGHSYGDEVLRGMGAILRNSVRSSDCVCRYGGEEFAILLPKTSPENALELARRIGAHVREHPWPKGQVTISAGVAFTGAGTPSSAELTMHADAALYAAKRSGRDRALLAGEEAEAKRWGTQARARVKGMAHANSARGLVLN